MLRAAEKKDTEKLIKLVMIILQDMNLPIIETVPADLLEDWLKKAMQMENYRYSYRNAMVCIRNGQVAGVCYSYNGELEPEIDHAAIQLAEQYEEIDGCLFLESETGPEEWYLDSLVTDEAYRGQGVASELLDALPEIAQSYGKAVIALNCEQSNRAAKKLYEQKGYRKVSERTISGHRYDHMHKMIEGVTLKE